MSRRSVPDLPKAGRVVHKGGAFPMSRRFVPEESRAWPPPAPDLRDIGNAGAAMLGQARGSALAAGGVVAAEETEEGRLVVPRGSAGVGA